MLHIGKTALSGRLLNLERFITEKGSGLLHPGLQKLRLGAVLKETFVIGKKLTLGKTALPAEPFHTPVLLTAGEHGKAEALKLFLKLRGLLVHPFPLSGKTSGKKEKKLLHQKPAALLEEGRPGKVFLLNQADVFVQFHEIFRIEKN